MVKLGLKKKSRLEDVVSFLGGTLIIMTMHKGFLEAAGEMPRWHDIDKYWYPRTPLENIYLSIYEGIDDYTA